MPSRQPIRHPAFHKSPSGKVTLKIYLLESAGRSRKRVRIRPQVCYTTSSCWGHFVTGGDCCRTVSDSAVTLPVLSPVELAGNAGQIQVSCAPMHLLVRKARSSAQAGSSFPLLWRGNLTQLICSYSQTYLFFRNPLCRLCFQADGAQQARGLGFTRGIVVWSVWLSWSRKRWNCT